MAKGKSTKEQAMIYKTYT